MEIVKANTSHIEELHQFARDNFVLTYGHMNTEENMRHYLANSFSLEAFVQEFNHPESSFWVVMNVGKVVGYYKANLGAAQTESDYPNSIEIERIYVTSELKGRGIGRMMIQHAMAQAKNLELKEIWLGVWEKNPKAIAFYKKMGFIEISTHVFQLGDDAQTDIIMTLTL
ncbi:GNAT family N-acetyltransferase [Marinoscillum sp.]|uniref:GNAT family N-acetyltransferase n=1 Tax=Marinoscillum sp. TaxID=2024838 RepID=UPI003BAA135B